VIIFLSDGECDVDDATIYDLCHAAVRLGWVPHARWSSHPQHISRKSLSLHTVSFGQDGQSHYLRRMATIAAEVYDNSPADPLAPAGVNPCTFSSALDTVSCLFASNPFIYSESGSTCIYIPELGRVVEKS
jgi:hypothetical protein